jgi:transposase
MYKLSGRGPGEAYNRILKIALKEYTLDSNKQKIEKEEILSIEDVQNIFKVSKVTIHKWKKKGLLPYYKMNRKVYFKRSEILTSMAHKKRKFDV